MTMTDHDFITTLKKKMGWTERPTDCCGCCRYWEPAATVALRVRTLVCSLNPTMRFETPETARCKFFKHDPSEES